MVIIRLITNEIQNPSGAFMTSQMVTTMIGCQVLNWHSTEFLSLSNSDKKSGQAGAELQGTIFLNFVQIVPKVYNLLLECWNIAG